MFRDRASERQRVVEQLRDEVRRLGGEPEDDGRRVRERQRDRDERLRRGDRDQGPPRIHSIDEEAGAGRG